MYPSRIMPRPVSVDFSGGGLDPAWTKLMVKRDGGRRGRVGRALMLDRPAYRSDATVSGNHRSVEHQPNDSVM
jgi:hypothetical protein